MNRLANSSSPYLLQHAANPVDWYPWGPEALQKARDENKLLLVSIGYSACHWCHVMEHESFEDKQVAAVMNEYFVCIKVDREERPDVDQIYMSAVQLMTGRGGWPLNCICLPDQRPIYGGTYFRKNDWVSLLFNLADFYKTKPQEAEEYAVKLTEGIRQYESVAIISGLPEYKRADLELIVNNWLGYFDRQEGGMGTAPKFPVPGNWIFLMRYAHLLKDEQVAQQVRLTLHKLAFGGIYDHIGGGFARYSVDGRWHVPHFEKMLYDNAQMVSLYAEAHTWKNANVEISTAGEGREATIVDEIIGFVQRELTSPEYGFYSALDADSEGVEGKFYTFTKDEIDEILGDYSAVFCIYYHVTDNGNWEEEHTNVFYRKETDEELAVKLGLPVDELRYVIESSRKKVLEYRSQRARPGLDHKIIASWNGLMLKGLCDAYRALNKKEYLDLALKNAGFILDELISTAGRLRRIASAISSPASISAPSPLERTGGETAFLDDYANIIDAFIALYEVTFDEQLLDTAKQLASQAIAHYYDGEKGVFYYTADDDEQLIARKSEIMDSVMPSSNSVMARSLKKLGLLFDDDQDHQISAQLLRNVAGQIARYGSSYANWATLLLEEVFGTYEVAITGDNAESMRIEMEKYYVPNKIMLGGKKGSLPLLQEKFATDTRIFICKDRTCGLPAANSAEALKQIHN